MHANPRTSRRRVRCVSIALVIVAAGTLTACRGASSGASGDEDVVLTMSWWGNDVRQQLTQEVIDSFEEAHPTIHIEGSSTEGSGYWDKLATEVAANDAPDIIQMDEKYLQTYSEGGALLDLSSTSLHTEALAPGMVEAGTTSAGLTGVPGAINTPVVVINPALFDEAGVDIPDDSTWTWDDYTQIAAEITEATAGEVTGSADYFSYDYPLQVWTRQHGSDLYDPDGGLAIGADLLTEWYEMAAAQSTAGAIPSPSEMVEQLSLGIAESPFATGAAAMVIVYSNQVGGLTQGLGNDEVLLLRPPSVSGSSADAQLWYRPSVFWSVDSRTEHPEEVAEFLDFLVNDPAAGAILLTDRGIPSNTEVLASIRDGLDGADQLSVAYVEEIAQEVVTGPPAPPEGLGSFPQILQRHLQSVLFGDATPEEAATATVDEAAAASASA